MLNGWLKPLALNRLFLLMMLLLGSPVRSNSITSVTSNSLTDQDKSEIIQSILEQELKTRELPQSEAPKSEAPNFPRGFKESVGERYLSTENIAFFRLPGDLASHLKLISRVELADKREKREEFECFIFKDFVVEDARVIVKLSIIRTSYFFGGYLDIPKEVKYEYRKLSGRWEGKLINTNQ